MRRLLRRFVKAKIAVVVGVFVLSMNAFAAVIIGTNFNDILIGTPDVDFIYGYGGNDRINGRGDDDSIYGGSGHDRIRGARGADTIYGNEGHDVILGGQGPDILYGESGRDRIFGQGGSDLIKGGDGMDFLSGGWGNDVIYTSFPEDDNTFDIVRCSRGYDVVFLGAGDFLIDRKRCEEVHPLYLRKSFKYFEFKGLGG